MPSGPSPAVRRSEAPPSAPPIEPSQLRGLLAGSGVALAVTLAWGFSYRSDRNANALRRQEGRHEVRQAEKRAHEEREAQVAARQRQASRMAHGQLLQNAATLRRQSRPKDREPLLPDSVRDEGYFRSDEEPWPHDD